MDNEASNAIGLRTMPNGIRVRGEGEWHARKHGGSRRRVWRKVHPGIEETTMEVRAAESSLALPLVRKSQWTAAMWALVRASAIGPNVLPELVGQIPMTEAIGSVTADGAYDIRLCHDAIDDRGAHAFVG